MRRAGSSRTKRELANALVSKLAEKQFSKISIEELTSACGIKRQSFYYHFQDIYALLDWTVRNDLQAFLDQQMELQDLHSSIRRFLEYLLHNQSVFLNLMQSSDQEYLERCFNDALCSVLRQAVRQIEAASHPERDEKYEEFLVQYYAAILSGVVKNWLCGKMQATADEMAAYFVKVLGDRPRRIAGTPNVPEQK